MNRNGYNPGLVLVASVGNKTNQCRINETLTIQPMKTRYSTSIKALVLVLLLPFSSPLVYGQLNQPEDPTDDSTIIYPASYFAEYFPVSANDMLSRIPGIGLALRGGGGGRGFGQGNGAGRGYGARFQRAGYEGEIPQDIPQVKTATNSDINQQLTTVIDQLSKLLQQSSAQQGKDHEKE